MPASTMTNEDEWKLPAETPFPAVLNAVEEKVIPYVKDGKDKTFTKWSWEFEITDGEYSGLRAWGDSEDRLTNHPENKVRQWAETLRGSKYEIGEGLDTDDLLGLHCVITVANETYIKKGTQEKKYLCPVLDVFPAGADGTDEPPF